MAEPESNPDLPLPKATPPPKRGETGGPPPRPRPLGHRMSGYLKRSGELSEHSVPGPEASPDSNTARPLQRDWPPSGPRPWQPRTELGVQCCWCWLAGRAPFNDSVRRTGNHMKERSSSSGKLRGGTWQPQGIRFPLKLEPLLGTSHTVWARAECWSASPSRRTFPRPAESHRPV